MHEGPTGVVTALAVNAGRVRETLRAFARIGYSPDGGMRRLAFSRADLRARQLLSHLLGRIGVRPRVDGIGNIFGHLPGAGGDELAPVLVGSHLDTVPGGGRFDGAAGVAAALEIVATLRERGIVTRHPLEVVSFAAEESSRFGRGTIGSGVVAGTWAAEEVVALRDADGITLGRALRRLGLDPAGVAVARRPPGAFTAFLELHIEQGRVLEASGAHLGIVEAIAAPTRLRLRLTGRADHSGATPMALRRDALVGAAEVVLAVERRARAVPDIVGTVGTLRVEPGAINVVPGGVELGIDVRGVNGGDKAQVVARIRDDIATIAATRELAASIEVTSDEEPVVLDANVATLLERHGQARDLPLLRLPSGAGHDAMQMARLCPSGMLMVPSRAGVSHNRAEWSDLDNIVAGTQVLLDATLELAGREDEEVIQPTA
ncbi:MAG: Zn-dependent hydrolase [Chloroflexota bacterium]|nr:Zn-dependent hydrolase [Chloroflexota bacterium]